MEAECSNLSMVLVEVRTQFDDFFHKLLQENMSMHSPLINLERSFRYEYSMLQQTVFDYIEEVGDLLTLLPRKRERRGLINAGGSLIKFLFGNPDSNDLENIEGKVRYLFDTTESIAHNNQEHHTVLANMQSDVVSHTKAINQIITTLQNYHKVMHNSLTKVYNNELRVQNQLKNLFDYLKLSSALIDVRDSAEQATRQVSKLHQAIQELAQGRLSSQLLSPKEYLKILKEIQKVLLPPTKLFASVDLENINKYYSVAIVQSYTTDHCLRVIIQLPLKTDDQIFESYDVISYPVYDHSLQRWTQWEIHNSKLLISQDRLLYTTYRETQFKQECKLGQLTICPLDNVILSVTKRPCCEVELFSKETVKACNRKLISGLQSPLLIRTPNRWLYSTAMEHRVTLNCYKTDGRLNVSSRVINGVGEMTRVERCDIITDEFKVPARIHGSSFFVEGIPQVKFPDVKGIMDPEEVNLVRGDLNSTLEILEGMDQELGTLSVKEYHLEGVFHRLRSRGFLDTYRRHWVQVVVVLTCLCLALMPVYLSFRCRKRVAAYFSACRARRQQRRHAALAKALEALTKPVTVTVPVSDGTSTNVNDGVAETQPGGAV